MPLSRSSKTRRIEPAYVGKQVSYLSADDAGLEIDTVNAPTVLSVQLQGRDDAATEVGNAVHVGAMTNPTHAGEERSPNPASVQRWRRGSDGVIVTTRARGVSESSFTSVLVTREDTGRSYWATWQGLMRKYEPLDAAGGSE